MIKKYLIERRSWIGFFLAMQLLILFVAYIDRNIPFTPIVYIVFLFMISFSFFLFIRYKKETKYYKSLEQWENNLDLTNLTDAESPFEKIIETSVVNQTERLQRETSFNVMMLEQEKDELLAWIHEVKTPLSAMNLMIDRLDDEKIKTQLTYEWLRIHLLLDKQLHQKRIPFIENDLSIEKIALKTIIFQEIKTLQSWCIQKGIGFDVHLNAPEVFSDKKWLPFIIRQLLTNAVKYSEAADIVITSYEQDGQVALEVKDFGDGIAKKDLTRIFDKGFTATTNYRNNGASGIGLHLAKKVAKSLFIEINVESLLGEGTTFTLTFPKKNAVLAVTSM